MKVNAPFHKNLLDKRAQGKGKSTDALKRAANYSREGYTVIYATGDYELCEEHKQNLEGDLKSTIFRGRTQPGMCEYLENLKYDIYKILPPMFLCRHCDKESCSYQNQKKIINHVDVIFTVHHNVPLLVGMVKDPLVILDDVDFKDVVCRESKVTRGRLVENAIVLKDRGLMKLNEALISWAEGNIGRALEIAKTEEFHRELRDVENFVVNAIEISGEGAAILKDFYAVFELYNATKGFDVRFDNEDLAIYWKDLAISKTGRVELVKAGVTEVEEELFAELGEYDLWEEKGVNPNVRLLQVADGKYSKTSLLMNQARVDEYLGYAVEVAEYAKSFDQKVLVMMAKEVAEKNGGNPVFSKLRSLDNVDIEYYYCKGSSGTNRYKEYDICVLVGILNKPPSYYEKPPYTDLIGKKRGVSGASVRDVMEDETRKMLVDAMGRLRGYTTQKKKAFIAFTNIDLEETGFKIVQAKRENLDTEVKRLMSWVDADRIKLEAVKSLLHDIRRGKVSKQEIADKMQEAHGLFTVEFYKKKTHEVAKLFKGWLKIENIKHRIYYITGEGWRFLTLKGYEDHGLINDLLDGYKLVDNFDLDYG